MLISTCADYFLSASYFDMGELVGWVKVVAAGRWLWETCSDVLFSHIVCTVGKFYSTESGLTFGGSSQGNLGMYKTHERDLLPFHGGFTFLWRNEETANCPTAWPVNSAPGGQEEEEKETSQRALDIRARKLAASTGAALAPGRPSVAPVVVTTIVYFYAWPSADTPSAESVQRSRAV